MDGSHDARWTSLLLQVSPSHPISSEWLNLTWLSARAIDERPLPNVASWTYCRLLSIKEIGLLSIYSFLFSSLSRNVFDADVASWGEEEKNSLVGLCCVHWPDFGDSLYLDRSVLYTYRDWMLLFDIVTPLLQNSINGPSQSSRMSKP